jgi:hypothetical protein
MKLQLENPTTHELSELQKLVLYTKEKYQSTFHCAFENEGYIFCRGNLINEKGKEIASSSSFMPIGNNLGKSRVLAEILCLVQCLTSIGETIEWSDVEEVSPAMVNPSAYSLTEEYILGASNIGEALRRVRESGYPNQGLLERHIMEMKNSSGNRKRATKRDVADFVFSLATKEPSKPIDPKREGKPIRSGAEWSRVKKLAQISLPSGYKSADEFANFASKSEVDAIELQNNDDNK